MQARTVVQYYHITYFFLCYHNKGKTGVPFCTVVSAVLAMESPNPHLFEYKGSYFVKDLVTPEYLDSLEDFEIRDSDVYLITYPKSGTMWTRNILSLIYYEGYQNGTETITSTNDIQSVEYNMLKLNYLNIISPRLFFSHLPYNLVPKGLRSGRGKVIYVARNPKDVLVSYYHFSKVFLKMGEAEELDTFVGKFLAGKVLAGSWLDHVEGWSTHRDDFNILFLTFEEMKKDLRSSVLKICNFLGKRLNEKEVDDVIAKAAFHKMKMDPTRNVDFCLEHYPELFNSRKGGFLRKGTIGDWKNTMTVAQNELFDSTMKERMEKLPFKFCWDIKDKL
uniref:Sulfotransferase n=1 Tax=Pogona vitticeps TaxID=103695 RepID=A0A6J0V0P8_9SAUR